MAVAPWFVSDELRQRVEPLLPRADEQLRRALAFWRAVGATRYVREGEELLAKTA